MGDAPIHYATTKITSELQIKNKSKAYIQIKNKSKAYIHLFIKFSLNRVFT